MNTLLDIFTTDCIVINSPVRNRDEAFALAGDLFEGKLGIHSGLAVDCINLRENLSSTALGSGVAIPHGIVAGIQIPVGCFIKLAEPIDFAAPDGDKVTILIFLLFPQITTHEHLQILSSLAQHLLDVGIRKTLISEQCPEKICQLLNLTIDFSKTLPSQESESSFNQSITSRNQDIQNYLEEWEMLEHRPEQNTH
jgi:PTS system nitrogen regulatory IIA component